MTDKQDAAGPANPRRETLSALLDGEASEFETRRLLQTLDQDDRQTWQRYALIQQSMQSSQAEPLNLSIDVSQAVSAAIDELEPLSVKTNATSTAAAQQTWLKPVLGFAAAASFAFVSVVGLQQYQAQSALDEAGFVAQGDVSASQLPIESGVGLSAVSGQVAIPDDSPIAELDLVEQQKRYQQQRLNYYLQQHAEQATMNNGRGLIPMVRVAE